MLKKTQTNSCQEEHLIGHAKVYHRTKISTGPLQTTSEGITSSVIVTIISQR